MRSSLIRMSVAALLASCTAAEPLGEADRDDHEDEETLVGPALMSKFARVDGWYESRQIPAPHRATRVAAMLAIGGSSDVGSSLEGRGIGEDGEPGPWVPLEVTFSENGLYVVRADLEGEASATQIRVRDDAAPAIELLTWASADPRDAEGDGDAEGPVASSGSGLAADLANAGILARSAWGARAPRCTSRDPSKRRMAIHHSVTARAAGGSIEAVLRQIQAFHMDGRGYCDVGYHFFAAADGRVFEARNLDTLGAHSASYNTGNIGIVFVGCFDSSGACDGLGGRDAPEAMMRGAASAVSHLAARFGIPIDGDRIKGHGEQPGQGTACPGDHVRARLDELRALARGGGQPPPPPPPGPPPPPPSPPSQSCGALLVNEALVRGAEIRSCDGLYLFAHQHDGNVVLYNTWSGGAVWATRTDGRQSEILVMQTDGNLVLYGPGGRPLWATGTDGHHGSTFAVQDDGNLVVYAPGGPVWASNTVGAGGRPPPPAPPPAPPPPPPPPPPAGCGFLGVDAMLAPGQGVHSCSGDYFFVHQEDGNVVLYNTAASRAVWHTGTHGRGTEALVMQGDGNLVLYAPGGGPLWASGTDGARGSVLAVQDDGNVVIYAPGGRPIWATHTVGR